MLGGQLTLERHVCMHAPHRIACTPLRRAWPGVSPVRMVRCASQRADSFSMSISRLSWLLPRCGSGCGSSIAAPPCRPFAAELQAPPAPLCVRCGCRGAPARHWGTISVLWRRGQGCRLWGSLSNSPHLAPPRRRPPRCGSPHLDCSTSAPERSEARREGRDPQLAVACQRRAGPDACLASDAAEVLYFVFAGACNVRVVARCALQLWAAGRALRAQPAVGGPELPPVRALAC